MNNYKIFENYRDNDSLRNQYYVYTETVFPGISFREWYCRGFWPVEYIPVSMVDRGRVLANVSIARMKILLEGAVIDGLQIGAVGTISEYRGLGLARDLMNYVLEKYESSADLIFLFANDEVYDFYPKFGFERVSEAFYSLESEIPSANFNARKLNINNSEDFTLILRLVNSRQDLTRIFGARDYGFVTLWHILNIHSDNLFYLADQDVIIIKTEKNDRMKIWDVIFSCPFDISAAIPRIMQSANIAAIDFLFPADQLKFNYDRIADVGDYALFVRGNFNIKNRSFKFPVTAET